MEECAIANVSLIVSLSDVKDWVVKDWVAIMTCPCQLL